MATDPDLQLPPHLRRPKRRKAPLLLALGVVVLVVGAVLALAVFEVQTLFIDDEVAEAGPAFDSGATTSAPAAPGGSTAPSSPATDPPPETPVVTTAATGTFVDRGHPGEGTATVLTDGTQAFVRFEDDFATDNGPDLRVRAYAGDRTIDLGTLKGNRGAQNYELPADVDPSTLTSVDVWCRRFDYVFTDAGLSPPS